MVYSNFYLTINMYSNVFAINRISHGLEIFNNFRFNLCFSLTSIDSQFHGAESCQQEKVISLIKMALITITTSLMNFLQMEFSPWYTYLNLFAKILPYFCLF